MQRAQMIWVGQAVLIVLPVVILSGVALHFLREDKAAIQQDAKRRAYAIAPDVARQIGDEISADLVQSRKQGVVTEGEIVDGRGMAIPDYPRFPQPSDWVQKLPAREAGLWRTAQKARFQHPDANAARTALTTLAQAGNSAPARANAQLGLLVASEAGGDPGAVIRQAVHVAQQYPSEVTESGTQVGDAALLVALRHVKGDPPPDLAGAIENQITQHPSFLSTDLLDSAALWAKWQAQEDQRQKTRYMMQDFVPRLDNAFRGRQRTAVVLYWNESSRASRPGTPPGLALCVPRERGWEITLLRGDSLRRALHASLPDYMGAWLNVAGRRWTIRGNFGSKFPDLSYAKGNFSLNAAKYPFLLVLNLSNPGLLDVPYHRRLVMMQWLVLLAVAAALLGLWRLWHTYRDQMRLNEMKSNLVSSVSHELRAPIAAVRLMAESLESGRVGGAEKEKDYYRLIVRECGRLSSLVENVLDFSRIDQGRKQYHFEALDAMALLRHTVMLMEPGAAERQVQLRLADPPVEFGSLQPEWDSEAIEQSMVNLIDNAVKHSPAGGEVRVEVELLPEVVRFWVVDRGPGIPADEHKKIFDLFYRHGSELRRETEGTGIGLSIVKHVAEAHGGRVIVESAVGQGSRFGLELPR
jgi:signal transduction histidine kinase